MAGKADLVNGIVDTYLQEVPERDGWKLPESSVVDGGFASAWSETPPESGSVRIGGTGGGGGN